MALKKKGQQKAQAQQKAQGKIGSSFDDFLAEQGILRECEEHAIKQILADQIKAAMEKDRLTKAARWPSVCKPAVERSIVCSIPPTRVLRCTLCNGRPWQSAVNSGWNLSEAGDASASGPRRRGFFRAAWERLGTVNCE
jgi:hypothetical protein